MNFRKDPLFASLIIVLLLLLITIGYFNRLKISNYVSGIKEQPVQRLNKDQNTPENNTITVSSLPADTAQYTTIDNNTYKPMPHNDTAIGSNKSAATNNPLKNRILDTIVSLVPRNDTPEFKKSIPGSAINNNNNDDNDDDVKVTAVSVSDNQDVICKLKSGKTQKLIVYPSHNNWHSIYMIAPITDRKQLSKKNIIQPEFEGVSYPTYQAARVTYKGKKYDVIQVAFLSTSVDSKHPYGISLQSNPSFVIFGEHKNTDWYVFENGRVEKFILPKDFNLTDN